MVVIGCCFYPSWQQVSWLDRSTGETGDQKLVHAPGEVEKFYRQFPAGTVIGMEATGNCQWVRELMARLGHEGGSGDAAKIRARDSRQQEDRKSAAADDAARRRANYRTSVRVNDGRCLAFSAWEAGGELSGTDSAGVQFGRPSAAGVDQ